MILHVTIMYALMCDDKNSTLSLAFFPRTHNHSLLMRKALDKAKLRNLLQNSCQGHEKQGNTEN